MAHALKQGEFCKLRGVTKGRGSQWKAAGLLVFDENGLVLVDESNARLDAQLDVQKRAARQAMPPASAEIVMPSPIKPVDATSKESRTNDERDTFATFNKARAEKEQELAISARLDREERQGTLVLAEQVRAAASQLAMVIGAGLDMLPGRIGSMLANEPDVAKREQLVEDECRRLREDFARRAAELATLRAPDAT